MKHHQHNDKRKMSRRNFLKGGTGLAISGLAARAAASPPAAEAAEVAGPYHGVQLRGMYLPAKNRTAEGRFGLMFKRLPAFAPGDTLLSGLGIRMAEEDSEPLPDDISPNINKSPLLFAGYTFLGQFIDHDITLDTTPLDLQQTDPDALTNFRTARYDLDSVYGRGPSLEPDIYDPADRHKLLIKTRTETVESTAQDASGNTITVTEEVEVEDVPRRDDGTAIIPEGRNDENLILVQLHIAFMKFHNRLVDYVRSQGVMSSAVFETARRLARWHYQWMVIHDFLPAIVGSTMKNAVYKDNPGAAPTITIGYYKPTNRENKPFMPVEYAVAAYRFGHSMIRPAYIINRFTQNTIPVFGATPDMNLNGRRPIPGRLVIDWRNILPNIRPNPFPVNAVRKPRRIDTRLSAPLFNLPSSVVPPDDKQTLLAVRNLLRGQRVGLPSGQQVAKQMRVTPLSNDRLAYRMTYDPKSGTDSEQYDPNLAAFLGQKGWNGEAPLWFYILKEAELLPNRGQQLGAVGGRMVAEVLVGLLQRDVNSYLSQNPAWKPTLPSATPGSFTISDLINYANGNEGVA